MWAFGIGRRACAVVASFAFVSACKKSSTDAKPETVRSAAPSATAAPEPAPGPCGAGEQPVELGKSNGQIHGIAADTTHVYFGTWQAMSRRGDLVKVRKDGKGLVNISSLQLEPRGIVVDDQHVFYTSGIRLLSVAKEGGESKVLADSFSSQTIAGDAAHLYGVPGDYGPYDRLIRAEKATGKTYELDVSERPEAKEAPRGFNAIAVDGSGIYVADSSGNRVLRYGFERAKPKVLATGQEKAFALVIDESNVYFTLAKKKQLMKVAKAGGGASKLAWGLVPDAPIAGDGKALYTVVEGPADQPNGVVRVPLDGGNPAPVGSVARDKSVDVLSVDDRCVYWIAREAGSGNAVVFARAR